MKRTITIISAALLSTALAVPLIAQTAMAQSAPLNTEYGEHHPYVEGFDGYLDQHREVREQLNHDPHLIDNPAYMANHPDLRDYMHEHQRAAVDFRRHPDRFMHREHVYNRSERRWDWHHRRYVDTH
jgi:Spy/CpxP family protein refolding chaperone